MCIAIHSVCFEILRCVCLIRSNNLSYLFIIFVVLKIFMQEGRTILFNNAFNTFYLFGIIHILKDHSDSQRGNTLLLLHELLFSIRNKGIFICTILKTG